MRHGGIFGRDPNKLTVLNMLVGVDELVFGVIIKSSSIRAKHQNLTRSRNKVREWIYHVAQEVCYEFSELFHSPRNLCSVSFIRVDDVPLVYGK